MPPPMHERSQTSEACCFCQWIAPTFFSPLAHNRITLAARNLHLSIIDEDTPLSLVHDAT